jgi:4,5-dihydroxyphthalate decarboxylase
MSTSEAASADTVQVILDDYAAAHGLRHGRSGTEGARFKLSGGPVVPRFRPFLEKMDVPIAEIPIMTFLAAKEAGTPIALLPAVVLAGSQHQYLFHEPSRGLRSPRDLVGRRVAIRAYSVTTAAWVRDILQLEHGVEPSEIEWVSFEPPHVAGFPNPASVVQAPKGTTPASLLRDGGVAAAVLRQVDDGDCFAPLIPDAAAAGKAWMDREGAVQINHMVCVTRDFAAAAGPIVSEFLEAMQKSSASGTDKPFLIGRSAVDRSLERAIACALRQDIIKKPVRADDLYAGNGLGLPT